MTWVLVDELRGDRVRSRLCVRQFKAEGAQRRFVCGNARHVFSSSTCWPRLRVGTISDYLLSTSVLHFCTLKSSRFGPLKAALNGHWQEFSCDKLVAIMLLQQNDINPCIYKRFCGNLDLEEHGDDFLVCGLTSNLEMLADEFKNNFLGKEG